MEQKVESPFQAILDYELSHSIPPGYINHTIQATSPNGSWQRIERGEVPLDDAWFRLFQSEIDNPRRWKTYWSKLLADPGKRRTLKLPEKYGDGSYVGNIEIPPMPRIDAKEMFWNMFGMSRVPDRHMYPAVQKLKASGRFVIAALSNAINFPEGIRDHKGEIFDSGIHRKAWSKEGNNVIEVGSLEEQGGFGEEREDIRRNFDFYISSANVGMRKPEKRIYEYAIKEIQKFGKQKGIDIQPHEILFLDDIGTNLRTARQFGMRTIKVTLGKVRDAVVELQEQVDIQLLEEGDDGIAQFAGSAPMPSKL